MADKLDKPDLEGIFQKLFEKNPLPMLMYDSETLKILLVNQAAVNKYGYSQEEFLSMTTLDIRPKEEKEQFLEFYKNTKKEKMLSANHGIWKHKKKNGEIMLVDVTCSEVVYRGREVVAIALADVTEKERGKQELTESEERFRLLAESAVEGIVVSENTIITDVSEQLVKIFGYDGRQEIIGKKLVDFIHPKDKDLVAQKMSETNSDSYETRCIKKDGTQIIVKAKGRLLPYHGGFIRIAVISDITQEKENEKKITQSEERYRHLFENNLAAVFRSEVGGVLVDFNQALVEILGFTTIEELKKSRTHEFYFSSAEREKYLSDLKKKGFLKNYQMRMRKKDGSEIWIMENVMLVKDSTTNIEYIEGTLIDITETKRIQEALQEREENYKSLIEHMPDGIFIHNEKGEVIFANPAALKIVGISSLDELQNKNLFSYVLPEHHDKIKARKAEMNAGKESPFIETKIRRPDGKTIEIETKTNRITYHGQPSVEVVLHDISLQRQLEREHLRLQIEEESNRELKREIASHIRTRQRLNASQKYTRLLIDSSIDMIFAYDQDGRITEFNSAAQKTFGYSFSEIQSKDMSVLYEDKERYAELKKRISEKENFFGEVKQIKKNGDTFPAFISTSLLKSDKGEIIGMMSISRDITHTKETEDQLKRSVHEKETLLKEIHHRVKNNLQVISSILKLQSAYVKDKKTLDLLSECRNRISSMAFIHATLYMTNDFANINFAEYVANLAGNLQQSYAGKDKKILLRLDIPKVFLHIDDAIPCGLIINELLSNSFKYAFAKKKKGAVGISVKVKKENIILAIWDDGSGFPKTVDYRNTESLGLQLVISLVEQLSGKMKMESKKDKGTKFIIAFRKSK